MNLYRKNNNSNNNTKINKSLPKSKSNSIFLTPFQNIISIVEIEM